jgi:hypothetical protein
VTSMSKSHERNNTGKFHTADYLKVIGVADMASTLTLLPRKTCDPPGCNEALPSAVAKADQHEWNGCY